MGQQILQILPTNYGGNFGIYLTQIVDNRKYSAVVDPGEEPRWVDRTDFKDFNRPLFTLSEDQVQMIKKAEKVKPDVMTSTNP